MILDSKEIKPVNSKGNQLWIFIGRTVAEAEALILWPPDMKSWLIGKDPDTGNNWSQEKGVAEAEMVRRHHPSMDVNLSKLWEIVENRGSQCATVHEVAKNRTWLNDCTRTQWHKVRCRSSSTYNGVTFRYCKLKIHLIHLTYQTSYVKCTYNTYTSLQLGKIF